jgi:hypothetical protein
MAVGMTSGRAILTLTSILASSGCKTSHQLSELRSSELGVSMSQRPSEGFALRILPKTLPRAGAGCRLDMRSLRATMNGVPLKRFTGIYAGGDLTYDRDCLLEYGFPGGVASPEPGAPPGMEVGGAIPVAATTPDVAVIRLEDSSATWTLTVPDAFTPRRIELVSPRDGVLHEGQAIRVRWHPGTDVPGKDVALLLSRHRPVRVEEVSVSMSHGRPDGDTIEFDVPRDLPPTLIGPATLTPIGIAFVAVAHSPCPVDACSVEVLFDVPSIPVNIGRP